MVVCVCRSVVNKEMMQAGDLDGLDTSYSLPNL